MSKRIVMSILFSVVCSIVGMVGTFSFKREGAQQRVTLIIEHPDSCFLIEPKSLASESTSIDVVSVPVGKNTFSFDCDGKQVKLEKDVKEGKLTWNVNPLDPEKKADPASPL